MLPEVLPGRRLHPVRAVAEVDLVQVHLEDLVLGEGPLHAHGHHGLADLPSDRSLPSHVRIRRIPDELLGDGGAALEPAARRVLPQRPEDGEAVDALVLVEPLVLGRQECLTHMLGDAVDRDVDAALLGADPGHRPPLGIEHERRQQRRRRVVRERREHHARGGDDAQGDGEDHKSGEPPRGRLAADGRPPAVGLQLPRQREAVRLHDPLEVAEDPAFFGFAVEDGHPSLSFDDGGRTSRGRAKRTAGCPRRLQFFPVHPR